MLFFISFIMFNFSYLFRVLLLVFFILVFSLLHLFRVLYLKYLIILVYVRGVVVFILYISCMCWNINEKFSFFILFFRVAFMYIYDRGLYVNFADVGDFLWIYLFFRVLFSLIVTMYSLNLFKVAGSLRF